MRRWVASTLGEAVEAVTTAGRVVCRNYLTATAVERTCSCCHKGKGDCGDDRYPEPPATAAPLATLQPVLAFVSIRCYAEPLEHFTQSQNASVQQLTTQGNTVIAGGLVPDHDYLVLELRCEGPNADNQHRFCRVDFVDEKGGEVTATLHRSFCSAVRRDLRGGQYLKEKWRVELDCSCGRACKHTLAAIQALLPGFNKRYHVFSNNCKAFVTAVLELLVGAGGPACLSSEQLHKLRSYLKDAKLVDGLGRGVDATMQHVLRASSALQQNLSSAAPSSRRLSTRAA